MDENQTRVCYKWEVGMGNLDPNRAQPKRRLPRGRCITCNKYTTLMYVDQCRTCHDFEEAIENGTA